MNASSRPANPAPDLLSMLSGPALRLHGIARGLVRRLPTQPPSFVAARLLDRLLWPRLDAAQRAQLQGPVVEVELLEPGLRVRLRVGARGFEVAGPGPVALTIRARSAALWRLASGADDADRLFFDRQLVMSGDTEFGLIVKNTLDAVGPLFSPGAAAR